MEAAPSFNWNRHYRNTRELNFHTRFHTPVGLIHATVWNNECHASIHCTNDLHIPGATTSPPVGGIHISTITAAEGMGLTPVLQERHLIQQCDCSLMKWCNTFVSFPIREAKWYGPYFLVQDSALCG